MKRINDLEQNSQCSLQLRNERETVVYFPPQEGIFLLVFTLRPKIGVQTASYPIEREGPSQ